MRFDAYAATVERHPMEVAEILHSEVGAGRIEKASGAQGYAVRLIIRDPSGEVAATVKAGGQQEWPHVDAQGEAAADVARVLRALWPDHRVTRVDSAEDFEEPGAFDKLFKCARSVALERRVRTDCAGDWLEARFGRTFYVGSRQSETRVRIYEKGFERYYVAGAKDLRMDWVRAEVQQRPKREKRRAAASATPEEVWGMSPWSKELLAEISAIEVPRIVAPARRAKTLDLAMVAMMTQWGGKFSELVEREGSPCAAGNYLQGVLDKLRSEKN